jgi:nitrite reductase/ring-hydroxylating ferredoxin subunit
MNNRLLANEEFVRVADGRLEGFEVECPWHQSRFDMRTGEVIAPPASEPEPVYEVKVDGNIFLLEKGLTLLITGLQ